MLSYRALNDIFQRGFYRIGFFVGRYPYLWLIAVVAVCIALMIGFVNFDIITDVFDLWTPKSSPLRKAHAEKCVHNYFFTRTLATCKHSFIIFFIRPTFFIKTSKLDFKKKDTSERDRGEMRRVGLIRYNDEKTFYNDQWYDHDTYLLALACRHKDGYEDILESKYIAEYFNFHMDLVIQSPKKNYTYTAHDGKKTEFVFSFFGGALKKKNTLQKQTKIKLKPTTLQKNTYTNSSLFKKFPPLKFKLSNFVLYDKCTYNFVFDVVTYTNIFCSATRTEHWKEPQPLASLRALGKNGSIVQGYPMEILPLCNPWVNSPLEAQFELSCYSLDIFHCFAEGGYMFPFENYLAKTFFTNLITANPYVVRRLCSSFVCLNKGKKIWVVLEDLSK
ncbi:hypothetical protein RFI_01871, partial [Reticulomyxa filosa]